MLATADELEHERPYLMGVAYRLLGSASDAEDVVQEALLRARDQSELRSLRAFLTTVVTRLCLDELRSARRRREQYVGPWLPEPVLTSEIDAPAALDVEHKESVSLALLVVLEQLSPLERAVFVLREVFDLEFAEIGAAIDRSEGACRKLLSRARARIEQRDRHAPAPPGAQLSVASDFFIALSSGDLNEVMKVLAPEVVITVDHGGKASAARKPVIGELNVARFLVGMFDKARRFAADFVITPTLVNGAPAALLSRADGTLESIFVLRIESTPEGPRIADLAIYRNPDKLATLRTDPSIRLPSR